MSKTLDIDPDVELWAPTLNAVIEGNEPICPRCKSSNMEIDSYQNKDGTGYLLVTCNDCGKSGYSSRVEFK